MDPSDDPCLKWFPQMMDQPDLRHALCVLHARDAGKITKQRMNLVPFNKLTVTGMIKRFKPCVLALYPLLAESPEPRLDSPKDLADR